MDEGIILWSMDKCICGGSLLVTDIVNPCVKNIGVRVSYKVLRGMSIVELAVVFLLALKSSFCKSR